MELIINFGFGKKTFRIIKQRKLLKLKPKYSQDKNYDPLSIQFPFKYWSRCSDCGYSRYHCFDRPQPK
jgi:hypothetical protein